MTRYYSEAEMQAEVRRQVEETLRNLKGVRTAVRTQNRHWAYKIVETAVNWVLGPMLGEHLSEYVIQGVDAVWDYFSELFSDWDWDWD